MVHGMAHDCLDLSLIFDNNSTCNYVCIFYFFELM